MTNARLKHIASTARTKRILTHRDASMTSAPFRTTTEVYPDSPRTTPEQCNAAQVAAVCAAIDYALARR